jgi:hypothetical protein
MNTPWLQCRSRGRDDDVGVVQWRRGDAGDASRRWQCTLGIGLGLGQWGGGSEVYLVTVTTGPHLLFIALRDGSPPATLLGWTSLIRTRD